MLTTAAETHVPMVARRTLVLGILAIALPLSVVASTTIGPVPIPAGTVFAIILHHLGLPLPVVWSRAYDNIIWVERLPRVVEGALVGMALATAGALFQGLLRNPLADPYLLGISSGAALGGTVAFWVLGSASLGLFVAQYALPGFAFAGALLAVIIVYGLARVGRRTPVVTLILAGVAVSALLSAAQTLIITQNPAVGHRLGSLYAWLSGGIIVFQYWSEIALVGIPILLALVMAFWLAPVVDTFALGEEGALHLGIPVETMKAVIVTTAALLVACAVALSGLVGFVGLFIPHACRLVLGPRHRTLLPAAALLGGTFLLWADVLARVALQSGEVPLGVITALIGGPFFLWLLRQRGTQ
jgi:iron complex transport system permease protein